MTQPVKVSCPKCMTQNNVPGDRLSDQPVCGKCRNKLFTGTPVELSAGNFMRFTSQNDLPVVVDFWAPWCGPCKAMAPAFQKTAETMEPLARFAKLDTQANQKLAMQFNIRSIPAMIVFKNGREVSRTAGAMPVEKIKQWVKNSI